MHAAEPQAPSVANQLTLALSTGVVVALAAAAGYAFSVPVAGISAIWPAAGVLLGWLLLRSRRDWPAMLLGAFAGNVLVDYASGIPLRQALSGPLVNVLESGLAALVVLRVGGRPFTLRSLRQVGALVVGGAIVSNAVTALLGAQVLGRGQSPSFARDWLVWWAGDGLGMMAFAPLLITVAPLLRRRPVAGWRRVAEAAITLGAIGVATWALTSPIPAVLETTDGLRYAVFPLLIWVALRFGPWAAASGVAVLTSIVMLDVARLHVAPGAAPPSTVAFVIHLYIFVALASLSALVPAAVMEERIAASEARHASELRFRRLAEQIREAFVEARLSPLRIEYVSPNWATLWGRPIDHAYDPAVWINSVHPEDRHLMEASLGMVTGGEDDTLTFRIRKPDATTRWIRGRVYAVKGAEQEVQGATAVLEDVTEQQLAGERTRQVQKMEALGRLAGGVAHDFNNMLTVIDGSAALLDLALPEAHEARPDLAAIRRAAASARSLTARLLAFSRSEPVEARPIALHAVVESASDIVTRLVGRKVTVQRRLEARNDLVLADRQHLEQVLVNLAVNAGDAMPSGGALMIATRAAQVMERSRRDDRHPTRTHYVCLSVQDTGHGMSAETKARAFEPFYTTKAEGKGTGLGLATVFSIAQQYGGFVTIDSTEGVGTTVEVYLPELPSTSAPPADT